MLNKNKSILVAFGVLLIGWSSVALAQTPNVVVGSASANTGDTTLNQNISVTFTNNAGGSQATGFQLDITFDETNLTAVGLGSCDTNGVANTTVLCTNSVVGKIRILVFTVDASVLPDGSIASFDFNPSTAPAGTYPLGVVDEEYADAGGVISTGGNSTDGLVTVNGVASYGSTPTAPNVAINLGQAPQNGTSPTAALTVQNISADATPDLSGSCDMSGGDAGVFSITPTDPFGFDLVGGATSQLTITCDTNNAVATYNSTLVCTHDGGTGVTSPVNYAVSCEIIDTPVPVYSSTPPMGSARDFGNVVKDSADPDLMTTIQNTGFGGGDGGTDLSGTCLVTNSVGTAFSGGGNFGSLDSNETQDVTVTCETDTVGSFTGNMACSSNGGPTANYPLLCTVTGFPLYDSDDPTPGNPFDLLETPQNNPDAPDPSFPDPTGQMTITNIGDTGSFLEGQCTLMNGSIPIYIAGGGAAYSIAEGAAGQVVTVACDANNPVANGYTDTLRCTHNEESPSFFDYDVTCDITDPEPGSYDSNEADAGDPIEMTPGGPVQDTETPQYMLEIYNDAALGKANLELDACTLSGDPQITVSPTHPFSTSDPHLLPQGGETNSPTSSQVKT